MRGDREHVRLLRSGPRQDDRPREAALDHEPRRSKPRLDEDRAPARARGGLGAPGESRHRECVLGPNRQRADPPQVGCSLQPALGAIAPARSCLLHSGASTRTPQIESSSAVVVGIRRSWATRAKSVFGSGSRPGAPSPRIASVAPAGREGRALPYEPVPTLACRPVRRVAERPTLDSRWSAYPGSRSRKLEALVEFAEREGRSVTTSSSSPDDEGPATDGCKRVDERQRGADLRWERPDAARRRPTRRRSSSCQVAHAEQPSACDLGACGGDARHRQDVANA